MNKDHNSAATTHTQHKVIITILNHKLIPVLIKRIPLSTIKINLPMIIRLNNIQKSIHTNKFT